MSTTYVGAWTRRDDAGRPVSFRAAFEQPGRLGGFTARTEQKQFAEVDVRTGVPVSGRRAQVLASAHMPDGDFIDSFADVRGPLPLNTTEYILDNGVKWSVRAWQVSGDSDAPVFESFLMRMPRTWQDGHTYREQFNVGVFGPTLRGQGDAGPEQGYPGVIRYGNTIRAYVPVVGDGAGHWGESLFTSVTSSLEADGKQIPDKYGVSPSVGTTEYTVPAEDAEYRLSVDNSRDPAVYAVSTRVRAQWTFRSSSVPKDKATELPLSVIRFSPELSPDSTAKAGRRLDVPFRIEGASAGRQPAKVAFEVSYDEGATWQSAEAVGGTHLSLRHPAEPGSVSLRAELTDDSGNTLVQTIERAYLTTR
ncbi:hypothetical protein [Streptomyces bluensis]|uniref:hypothetical protein n=1 Tax=Streptomyces bluensis TaxID=33897 RepID=UPI00331879AA